MSPCAQLSGLTGLAEGDIQVDLPYAIGSFSHDLPGPNPKNTIAKIQIGNMYSRSLGQAGSPYVLWPNPLPS